LCVKDAFAKKFLVSGEISLAARSHRFFGNTLVKAGHLMRPSVVSGTVRTCLSPSVTDRAMEAWYHPSIA